MDEFQKKLMQMIVEQPNCISSRQKLKAMLSDYLPASKMHVNVLLNAFDEDIIQKLSGKSDVTLVAIRFVKQLMDDYGMTDANAFWAVETWCYLLGLSEVASALNEITPNDGNNQSTNAQSAENKKLKLTLGIYMAGLDFPPGDIKISVISLSKDKQAQEQGVYFAILKKGSSSNEIVTNGFTKQQAILSIKEGQRLQIGWQGDVELTKIGR